MKLTSAIQKVFKQALFEGYGIECTKIEEVAQNGFIRFTLKGLLDNKPFKGSLNIFHSKDNDYEFNITGFYEDDSRSFMDYILNNNIYIQSIQEINEFLLSNFDRPIEKIPFSMHIATGRFTFERKLFTNVFINANVSFKARLEICQKETDTAINNILLEYAYEVRDGQSHFNYTAPRDYIFCSSIDNMGVDGFKKVLLREYMLSYSILTQTTNLLRVEDFTNLSYEHILDYLTVQHMNDI